jgi:ankyrin repeat protein
VYHTENCSFHACDYGVQALQQAITNKDLSTISRILDAKVNMDYMIADHNGYRETALGTAIRTSNSPGYTELSILLEYSPNLQAAVASEPKSNENFVMVKNQNMPESVYSALLSAISRGDVALIKILVEAGADVNHPASGTIRYTPLQLASKSGNVEVILYLLDKGANVNAAPARFNGSSCLQLAAISGSISAVIVLLGNGADINAPASGFHGRTALEGAAEAGRIDMVQFLFEAGVKVLGQYEAQYKRALSFAKYGGFEAVVHVLERNFDIRKREAEGDFDFEHFANGEDFGEIDLLAE